MLPPNPPLHAALMGGGARVLAAKAALLGPLGVALVGVGVTATMLYLLYKESTSPESSSRSAFARRAAYGESERIRAAEDDTQ